MDIKSDYVIVKDRSEDTMIVNGLNPRAYDHSIQGNNRL